jgi:inosose dehydratase
MTAQLAGAPISWGVCEVPDWGLQLAASRVLSEMHEVGLVATEFGPDGFLPADPVARAVLLDRYGLAPVGGFVPAVLHDPDHDPLPGVAAALDGFLAVSATTLVLAAATGTAGYDARPAIDALGWQTLLSNLDRLAAHAASRGITATLHPHVGTMVERGDDVRRVLDRSDVPLCLDTGHLLIGGTDPAALARELPHRIAHVHFKDVDAGWAERVRAGTVTYTEAVRQGMYRPLGHGDVDVAAIVAALADVGYSGWYVMEQDTVLATEPSDSDGPMADVRTSLAYLTKLLS